MKRLLLRVRNKSEFLLSFLAAGKIWALFGIIFHIMNHSPAFWAQVERALPDYRKSREWLREHEKELIGRL